MNRQRVLAILCLLAILSLTACGGGQPAAKPGAAPAVSPAAKPAAPPAPAPKSPAAPKQVTLLQGVNITSMDPHQESSLVARQVYFHMYDMLLNSGPDLKPRPGLAESWNYINDLTLELKLRKNVKYHNGEPFNAAAVKFSLERIADPKLKGVWRGSVAHVKEIKVIDDYTVHIISKTPYAPGLSEVGRMFMLPPKYLQEVGNDKFNLAPIGTGAFKFKSADAGGTVTLEANPDYWGGKPQIDRLVFRTVPESMARVTELLTGRADIITDVPPELEKMIKDSKTAHTEAVDGTRNVHVYLDTKTKPLDDKRVRQALNLAINKDELVSTIYGGNAKVVGGPIGTYTFGFDPNIKGYGFDPARARQLLADAGLKDGFEITFRYGPGRFTKDAELAEALAGQLGKVGVKVKLDRQEWGVYWGAFSAGKLNNMFLLSMGTTGEPDVQLKWFHAPRFGQYYNTPTMNKALSQMLETVNETERLKQLQEIQKVLIDEAPFIFLFDLKNISGVSNRLKWKPWPNEYIWLHNAEVTE